MLHHVLPGFLDIPERKEKLAIFTTKRYRQMHKKLKNHWDALPDLIGHRPQIALDSETFHSIPSFSAIAKWDFFHKWCFQWSSNSFEILDGLFAQSISFPPDPVLRYSCELAFRVEQENIGIEIPNGKNHLIQR
jgi:hypothetical protein